MSGSRDPETTKTPVVTSDVERQLRPGLIPLLISMIIASSALVLFCYSLGLGLKELAGQAAAVDQPLQVKRVPLAIAMVGFGVSMLVFWVGYIRLARSRSR